MKHGLGLNKILGTIHSYPTMSELNKYVAGDWKKPTHPKARSSCSNACTLGGGAEGP